MGVREAHLVYKLAGDIIGLTKIESYEASLNDKSVTVEITRRSTAKVSCFSLSRALLLIEDNIDRKSVV